MVTSLFENLAVQADVMMLEFPVMTVAASHVEAVRRVEEETSADTEAVLVEESAWQSKLAVERAYALEQARKEWEVRLQDGLETERSAIAMACTSFALARARYFAEVEHEVVKLSLGIAARVLQREVAMDSTLLAGVVRVALSKLSEIEGAELMVPAKDVEMWRRAMKASGLRVGEDEALGEGEVQLRTNGGVADLGIKAQLVEIERGFFDLLAKRPA